jgi:2-methylfumaryl-CoA isomerase
LLGEHTDEILEIVLGMSTAEIARLHDQKIVAGPEAVEGEVQRVAAAVA